MNAIKRLSSFLLAICLLCNLGMTAGCPVALAADAPSESKEETTATTEGAQDANVPPSEEPEEPDPASPTQGSAAPAASEPTTSTDDSASTPEEPVFSAVRQAEGWQTAVTYGISIPLSDGSCPEIFVTDSEDSVIPLQQMEDGSYQVTICSNGTYTVSTTVQDIPYNWEILETQIDSEAPQILGLRRTEQGWTTKGSYTFTVVDELSGVQEVYLTVAQQTPVLLTADENGLYSFTLQENAVFEITVCDAAGNEAELQAEETQVDTVAPDILDLTRTAEGWSQSVIYTFRAEDDLSGVADVTVSIEGLAPFAPESSEGVYQFALDQNVAFQIRVSDAAGNITMIASEETQVDTTAPSLGTLSRSTEGWAQSAVYNFTAEDAASGVATVQILTGDGQIVVPVILNGSYTYTAAKNETFQILLTDAVGNTAQYPVTEDQIDKFGPEISQIQREQESWTQEAAYSFTVADNAAGIRSVRVLLENGTEASLTEENGRYRFTLTQNSEFTIVAEDMVGNTSEVTAQEDRVDTLAPQILELTRLKSGWATTATYSFRAEDTQAGIASVAVVIGDGDPQLLEAVNGVYTVTVFENTVLTITVTDGAGNTSSVTQEETQIDTVAPVVSEISREKESWQQIVQYTFAAEDIQSGIESVVLEVNGNSAELSAENGAYRFTAEANGTYTIRVTDKVGNTTVQTVSEELVDTQPPMIRDLQRATSNWATETSYSFQAEDVQSGIVAATLLLPDGTGVELTEADGNYTFCAAQNGLYTITVTDGVGHTSQVVIEETQIDREGPVFGKVIRVTNSWSTSAQYEFTVQDANVQVSKVLLVVGQEQTELTALDGVYSFILPKNGEFTILAEDELENRTEYRAEEAQVDTILPEVSVPARQIEGWQPSVTYVFYAEDNDSGIRKISVTDLDGNTILFAPHSEGYSFSVNYNTVVKIAVTDWAGNITEVTTEENFVDTTAPQILDVQRGTMGWSQNALFNFRVEDIQSGVAAVEVLLGDAPVPVVQTETGYAFLAEANGTYRIRVTDTAGNIAVVSASEKQIDQTPPKIWDISDGGQWDDNVILISFCVSDESQLGSVTLTDENGIQMEPFTRNGTLYYDFIYANGTYTITVTDAAGNETSAPLEIWRIDAEAPQAPVLTSSAQELWVNSDVILTAQSQDSQSGVINYWYTTDPDIPFRKGKWKKLVLEDGIGSLTLSEEQSSFYRVVAEDGANNISAETRIWVGIDKTAPQRFTLAYSEDAADGYVTSVNGLLIYLDQMAFQANALDEASGIVRYAYRVEGGTNEWVELEGNEVGFRQVLTGADGVYSVYIRALDRAGNWSEEYTLVEGDAAVQYVIENTPQENSQRNPAPELTLTVNGQSYDGSWTRDPVQIDVSGSWAVSGVAYYEYKLDQADLTLTDMDWQKAESTAEAAQVLVNTQTNATFTFRAVSYAGNYSQEVEAEIRFQEYGDPVVNDYWYSGLMGDNSWYTKLPGIEGLAPPADPSGSTQYQIHPYDIPYDIHASLFFNGEYVKTAVVADDGGNYLPKLEEDGIWEIRTHIQDALGNEFRHETQEVRIDTTVPEVLHIFMNGNDILQTVEKEELQYLTGNFNVLNNLAAKPSEYYLSEPVTISVEAWDATSGMARIYYNLGSSTVHPGMENGVPAYTWTQLPEDGLTISEEGEYVLTVMVVDNAGNRTICSAKTFTLDLSAPGSDSSNFDITLRQQNLSAENVYFGDVAVDITVMEAPWNGSDAENLKDAVFSGLSRITYRVLADGVQTQTGQIYPGSGETEEFTNMEIGAPSYGLEKVIRWTGSLEIDSALNDSNAVVLEVTATDAAGNSRTVRTDLFRIDRTKPVVEASFDTNDPVSSFDGEAAFTGSRTLTVNVLDKNFLPEKSIITVKDLDTGKTLDYTWEGGEDVFSAVIPVTQDGHYTVSISVTDAAGNHMEKVLFADGTAAEDAFIIDNTRPVITAAWDNNTVSQERYFAAGRTLTVTVNERNFDPDNISVQVVLTKPDGSQSYLPLDGAWISAGNTHTATVTCYEDGIYTVKLSGEDALSNAAVGIRCDGEAASEWVLDTVMEAPVFVNIADGDHFSGSIVPQILITDVNVDTAELFLYRTRRDEAEADVTEELLSNIQWTGTETTLEALLDIFPEVQEYDGIYKLVATCTDKAGNSNRAEVQFSINRFGSFYVYKTFLTELNGSYLQNVTDDLVFTEYNASGVVPGSARVVVTLDGEPIPNPSFQIVPANDDSGIGESGWYEYLYIISKENFLSDGVYEVIVSTQDHAGNVQENTAQSMKIQFAVDTTVPELTSIVGMEESIVEADSIQVNFSASDNVALSSVAVYINDERIAFWQDIGTYSFSESFRVGSGLEQRIRIEVTDLAGNTLSTEEEDFLPGYGFHRTITVSTNALLRYYANKPLFYGSIGAVIAAGGLSVILAMAKKKKKK